VPKVLDTAAGGVTVYWYTMFLKIEPSSPVPLYRQIVDQIRFSVASGRLAAEAKVPSVRDLAQELQINLQTVAKAYAELVREGTLDIRRGMGTYVSARVPRTASLDAREEIEAELRALARHAFAYGFTVEEVQKLLSKLWREETK
jgi:GntR family transcriptional regulator